MNYDIKNTLIGVWIAVAMVAMIPIGFLVAVVWTVAEWWERDGRPA